MSIFYDTVRRERYCGLGAMRHACFMGPNNIYKDIPPGCYEIAKDTPKKSIIFFGDSTAYHLMEGFQAVLGEEYEIYAFVSASCAPVIGYSEPENPRNCIFNNDAFLHNIIDRNHYDLVIISANIRFDERIKGMPEVRHIFEERGIPYVLLGQMPYFKAKPADTIARYGKVAGLDDAVRASLVFPCDQNEYGLDQTVPPNAFFSMKALLCRDGYPVYEIGGRLIHSDHIHFHQYGKLEVSKRIVAWLSQHGYVGERWAEVDQNHSALAK